MTRRAKPSAPTWSTKVQKADWFDSKIHRGITIDWPNSDDPTITDDVYYAEQCQVGHILARVAVMAAPYIYDDRVVHDCLRTSRAFPWSSADLREPPSFGTHDPSRDDADVCDMSLLPISRLAGPNSDSYRGEANVLQLIFPVDQLPKYRFLVPLWLTAATIDAGI